MANQVRTIFANMSWMVIAQLITSVCAFIWTILIARYLGVSDYGIFGFAVSLTAIFCILQDLGIGTHILRSISADPSLTDRYMGNGFTIRFLLSLVYLVVIYIILLILGASYYTTVITMLFALEDAIVGFNGLHNNGFQAFQKLKHQAKVNIFINISLLLLVILVIYLDLRLFGIACAYLLAYAMGFVFTVILFHRHIAQPKLRFEPDFAKYLIICGLPFALSYVFYTIYYQIDIVMLTQMVGSYATGMYTATYKLINVLTLFYSIYTAVIFPVMSKLYTSEKELLRLSFEKSIKYLLLITLPVSLGMTFYATDIIVLIYGTQYVDSDAILRVLIWTISFLFVNGACCSALNASHKEVSVTKIYILAAIFNICVNFILIPKYSYIGASAATVLSDILICILCFYVLKQIDQLPNKRLILDIVKIIAATGVLGIALYILNISMWLAIPVGIVIYFVVIFLLRTIDDDDKNVIRQIIGK